MSEKPSGFKPGDVLDQEIEGMPEQEMISKYKPTFLGMGGEQIVFGIEGHPNVVAKVRKHTLGEVVNYNRTEGISDEELHPAARAYLEKQLRREQGAQKLLKTHFPGHTLLERQYIQQVPVTRQMMEAIKDRWSTYDELADGVHHLWTTVRIQEKLPPEAMPNQEAISLSFQYVEQHFDDDEVDAYDNLNTVLLDGAPLEDPGLLEEVLPHALLDAMDQHPELKHLVSEFAEHAITYTQATGEMLDLAGSWNVTVFEKDGTWDYVMPDAIYPARDSYTRGVFGIDALLHGKTIEAGKENTVLNTISYARFVNALAMVSGSSARLKIFDQPIASNSEVLLHLAKRELSRWSHHETSKDGVV
ncbi:TPA: hypothetical protein DEB00_00155 [Candidatus Uhrbacteria bacterium]|nr:hypothetical protein [Candidatus Uhrbacteria bacterium]